jgi:hypothetical protein
MNGAAVGAEYWKRKNYEGIKTYCEKDVNTVMDIMLKSCFE